MKHIMMKRIICMLTAIMMLFTCISFNAYADETATVPEETTQAEQEVSAQEVQLTLEEQRAELEARLKASNEKLKAYEESSKETMEYIEDLDEKIGYLNQELSLLEKEIAEAEGKVKKLNEQIEPLKTEIDVLQAQYDKARGDFDKLQRSFTTTYNAYCLRLRAMYVSGSDSILVALLTSDDLAQFFSRYEMIKAVSRSDTSLLAEVNRKMEQITTQQNGLNERLTDLNSKKSELDAKQNECTAQQNAIEKKQKEVAEKKIILSDDRAESDALLAKYTARTKQYTEYRNEDAELVAEVDAEINDLINGLKDPSEVTTVNASVDRKNPTDTPESDASTLYSRSNGVLNMRYPVPSHHAVSQAFGHYRNGSAHTGIDYPCPMGSKVVAAQKGIVITVKRLNYSYGYYVMVYHGTDKKGRKAVTLYAHNSSILVSVGQTVSKGQQIAKSGSTGNSTGPHCHFELILGGAKVNPKNYLS